MISLTAGLIQLAFSDNPIQNQEKTAAAVRDARKKGADLIALPELHRTPYFCQTEDPARFDLAEEIPGPSTDFYGKLAKELSAVLVISLFEKRAPGLYHNTAVVLDSDGQLAGTYRKMHIPDDPAYYEKFYFTPGDTGFKPVRTSLGNLGVLVCWDQWYPEAARLMALAGADILIYPTAIGWEPSDDPAEKKRQREAWITVQRAHAVSNGLTVLSVNRTGFEQKPGGGKSEGIEFWGSSFAAGPQGEILAQAGADREETLITAVDGSRTETVRRIWPFFRDRRIDSYGNLLNRYADQE